MSLDPISQLTPRERDCLRLVAQGNSSKEIAVELGGISPIVVDNYLKSATGKLGVRSRRDAARMLQTAEINSLTPIQKLDVQTPALAKPQPIRPFEGPRRIETEPRFYIPVLRQGKRFNDLGPAARLGFIGLIAIATMLALTNFLGAFTALYGIGLRLG